MYLDLAQFITKNHLPFSMANPLLSFIQEITSKYEPRLIERSHISTTTAIKIIRECIGTTLKESLFDQMRSKPFSILTDQSSDVYGGKYLALLIRYIDIAKETPVTKLISIVEIESCSTGLILYNKVKQEFLIDEEYIRNNFMAICTDNESKMISTKSFTLDTEARLAIIKGAGLSNRLMKDISHLVHVRDLCHLYNLIYEDALQELPVFAIEFIKQICSYFGKGLRDNRLREIQLESGVKKPLSVIGFVEIRWTSMLNSVERILDLWIYIKKYFEEVSCSLAEKFLDPEYELYTYLVYILLHKLFGYNIYFQNSNLLYDEIYTKIQEGFLLFSKMLLKKESQELDFNILFQVNFQDPEKRHKGFLTNFEEFKVSFSQRYPRFNSLISTVINSNPKRKGIERECYTHAQRFINKVVTSMQKRLPFKEEIYLKCQVIYLREKTSQIKTWRELATAFPNVITKDQEVKFSEELDLFELNYKTIYQSHLNSEISIVRRWEMLSKNYYCMAKLAKALMVLPYSSAPVESLFSEFKVFKTAYRNQITVESLEASILSEQSSEVNQSSLLPIMLEKYFLLWKNKAQNEEIDEILAEKPPILDSQAQSEVPSLTISQSKEAICLDQPLEQNSASFIMEGFFQPFLNKMVSQFDNIDMKCVLENFLNSKMTQIAYQQAQPDQILKDNVNDRNLSITPKEGGNSYSSKRKPKGELVRDDLKKSKPNSHSKGSRLSNMEEEKL